MQKQPNTGLASASKTNIKIKDDIKTYLEGYAIVVLTKLSS
jgi:hypothetical protein